MDLEIVANHVKKVEINSNYGSEIINDITNTQTEYRSSITSEVIVNKSIRYLNLLQICNAFRNIKILVIKKI